MCQYVNEPTDLDDYRAGVKTGDVLDVGNKYLQDFKTGAGSYWECWHPETDSWEAIYEPPQGMSLYMTPGSKVRVVKGERPEHSKNLDVYHEAQMRDLIAQK